MARRGSQKRTFARRERERAIAEATPRSARQGMMLSSCHPSESRAARKGGESEPRPERATGIHQDLMGAEPRDVCRGRSGMDLVPI